MEIEEILQHLQIDGWSVVEGVIPADGSGAVCAEAEATTTAQSASHTYRVAPGKNRACPAPGAFWIRFLPYLSDEQALGVATRGFGPASEDVYERLCAAARPAPGKVTRTQTLRRKRDKIILTDLHHKRRKLDHRT